MDAEPSVSGPDDSPHEQTIISAKPTNAALILASLVIPVRSRYLNEGYRV
jgi:hypothetical protein